MAADGPPKSPWPYRLFPAAAIALVAAIALLGGDGGSLIGLVLTVALFPILFGTVFASVHHAETIAERIGEPYGTLVLTLAVTTIEVALIVSIMLTGDSNPTMARDTVFAVFMIVCNGLVGICILLGGLKYREQGFRVEGAGSYLSVLVALVILTLVLPNFTLAVSGPLYSTGQLAFVSTVTLALYAVFLYIQTIRHQDYFVIPHRHGTDEAPHARPSNAATAMSFALLLVSIGGVVLLAKKFARVVDTGIEAIGAPDAVAGVLVAILILLPEGVAAMRAARRDELQRSINLALGSSLATIGLTVPAVAVVTIVLERNLILGLDAKEEVLLALTIFLSLLTFGTGRTNILFGFVHLVVFATFVFLQFVP